MMIINEDVLMFVIYEERNEFNKEAKKIIVKGLSKLDAKKVNIPRQQGKSWTICNVYMKETTMWLKERLTIPVVLAMNQNMQKLLLITFMLMMKKTPKGDHVAQKVSY